MPIRRASDQWNDNQVSLDVGDTLTLTGNVTVSSITGGTITTITNPVATKGNVTIDSGVITTITNPVAIKGNLTINSGVITTVTAVTDITNPIALKGNLTINSGTITAVTDITNPVALKGNVTLDDGSIVNLIGNVTISDSKGFIGLVSCASIQGTASMSTLIAGEDQTNDVLKVEGQFTNTTYVSNSTSAVKSAAGLLHVVNIGNISCPTIALWDNIIPSGTLIHRIYPNAPVGTYIFDSKFTTGLTIDVTAGVAPAVQISYR